MFKVTPLNYNAYLEHTQNSRGVKTYEPYLLNDRQYVWDF